MNDSEYLRTLKSIDASTKANNFAAGAAAVASISSARSLKRQEGLLSKQNQILLDAKAEQQRQHYIMWLQTTDSGKKFSTWNKDAQPKLDALVARDSAWNEARIAAFKAGGSQLEKDAIFLIRNGFSELKQPRPLNLWLSICLSFVISDVLAAAIAVVLHTQLILPISFVIFILLMTIGRNRLQMIRVEKVLKRQEQAETLLMHTEWNLASTASATIANIQAFQSWVYFETPEIEHLPDLKQLGVSVLNGDKGYESLNKLLSSFSA